MSRYLTFPAGRVAKFVVLGVCLTPGKRIDYLLPAIAPASVLVAWGMVRALRAIRFSPAWAVVPVQEVAQKEARVTWDNLSLAWIPVRIRSWRLRLE